MEGAEKAAALKAYAKLAPVDRTWFVGLTRGDIRVGFERGTRKNKNKKFLGGKLYDS